ncbi:MAG: D-hexose-6-phosphate mutarotase [Verrucomicrobiota bacterium JB023]|nr:D-hexose-6-phosphate mutarotase [Verrucomicrobiota bacterium JB023]
MTLPNGVSEIELAPGYPALKIETPFCSAVLALHGAHLTHWQPSQAAEPVIYNSPEAIYREGKAIRGGIPLCWPWFNAHPSAPDQHPSHGVARNRFWEVDFVAEKDGNIIVRLVLTPDEAIAAHVPFDFELVAHFVLGESLEMELTTTNRTSAPVPVGGALHTYYQVSGISQVKLHGLQNTPYLDTTVAPEGDVRQEEEELAIEGEVDRIYYGTANEVTILDEGWQRRLKVAKKGSLTTVVWNPWTEKAAALGDLPDEGYRDFVCVEACNARHDTRIVAPGESHTLATSVVVESL